MLMLNINEISTLKHDFLNFVNFWDCLQFWASQVVLRDACGNTLRALKVNFKAMSNNSCNSGRPNMTRSFVRSRTVAS